MTRNLKAFGLALVAMLAIGAIGAQGASAVVEHSFRSGANETVLTGQNESYSTGGSKDVFTATAGLSVECDATFQGKNTGTTTDTVTVYPKYSSCLNNTTVHTKGCKYIFDSDTTQVVGHSASSEHATVSLSCEAGHRIEITRPGCNIAFDDNHGGVVVNQSMHGVKYTNLTNHPSSAITVNATVKTIKYEVTGGSFCGLAGHPAGTYSNGTYNAKASVTGFIAGTPSGTTTDGQTWTHGAQTNINISTPT